MATGMIAIGQAGGLSLLVENEGDSYGVIASLGGEEILNRVNVATAFGTGEWAEPDFKEVPAEVISGYKGQEHLQARSDE